MIRSVVLAAGAAVCVAVPANASLLIDSFDVNQAVTANSGTPSDSDLGVALGATSSFDNRDLAADWVSGPNDITLESNSSASGLLNYSTGADTNGNATVTWNSNSSVDLTLASTLTGIQVGVIFDDLPATLTFTADDGTNSGMGTLNLPGGIFAPTTAFIPFASFSGAVDFTSIVSLSLNIEGRFPATDIQIDFIRADIPAPGAAALFGAAGLLAARRRR